MRTVIITGKAERDIEDIWDYIAEDNFDAADRVRREIKAEIQKLAEQPGIGHERRDVPNKRYRFWKIYLYLIVYRYDDRQLAVLRVVHGARDIGTMF